MLAAFSWRVKWSEKYEIREPSIRSFVKFGASATAASHAFRTMSRKSIAGWAFANFVTPPATMKTRRPPRAWWVALGAGLFDFDFDRAGNSVPRPGANAVAFMSVCVASG